MVIHIVTPHHTERQDDVLQFCIFSPPQLLHTTPFLDDTWQMSPHKCMSREHGQRTFRFSPQRRGQNGHSIQQPPTGQNYGIGCVGTVMGTKPPAPFNQPQGYIEGTNQPGLDPPSLYRAQFNDRLNIVGVREREDRTARPATFALLQNFPNPFNPGTTIEYTLSERQPVSLQIFDISGRLVAVLVQSDQDAGRYRIRWNASRYANGAYFLRLSAGHHSDTKKLILEK